MAHAGCRSSAGGDCRLKVQQRCPNHLQRSRPRGSKCASHRRDKERGTLVRVVSCEAARKTEDVGSCCACCSLTEAPRVRGKVGVAAFAMRCIRFSPLPAGNGLVAAWRIRLFALFGLCLIARVDPLHAVRDCTYLGAGCPDCCHHCAQPLQGSTSSLAVSYIGRPGLYRSRSRY